MTRYVLETKRRATVLTLYWQPNITKDQVHLLSLDWARQSSGLTHYLAEVRVQVVAEDDA